MIDESVESQDEQEFGEYDSSSPFSDEPGVQTPSPDEDGRIPPRFNVFGEIPLRRLRRSLPNGPYGPRSSSEPEAEDVLDYDEEAVDGTVLYTTRTGRKFHKTETCPGLLAAAEVMRSRYCEMCSGGRPVGRMTLFGRGGGHVLHLSRGHAQRAAGGAVRTFGYCTRCATMD